MLEVIKYSPNVLETIFEITCNTLKRNPLNICLVINSVYNSDNLRVIFAKRREEDKNFYLSFRKLRRL